MHSIAALNRDSSEKVTVCSLPFVCRYTDTGVKTFTAGAGFATGFLTAGTLATAFLAGAFFPVDGFFFVAVFGAAVFLTVGMSPPIAFKVSITGCYTQWFDTG